MSGWLAARVGSHAALTLLAEVARGAYRLESFDADDIATAHEVIETYGDLDAGLADASIVVLSRRYGAVDVLTLDERHLRTLRGSTAGRSASRQLMAGHGALRQAGAMPNDLPELVVIDAAAWRAWLVEHDEVAAGVWLVLAKKGTTVPTGLTYDQALEEALCHGWIDGQVRRRDDLTYRQRFTPRRSRSAWSQRNVAAAERLIGEGRMQAAGLAAVEAARSDGRWQAAYAGQAQIVIPDDLAAALAAEPAAQAMFELLTSQNRYAVLYRVQDAKRAETRARRIERFVAMLARGETPHPQRRTTDR